MRLHLESSCLLALSFLILVALLAVNPAHAQSESILYSFTTIGYPETPLVIDRNGNLFGTYQGGPGGGVYKLTASGVYTTLYAFTGVYPDGAEPFGTLAIDPEGNLYGTTFSGGTNGGGTIFEISPTGTETILHNFNCSLDGCYSQSGLVMDAAGNLYGATSIGGSNSAGTLFKFVPSSSTLTTLYSFAGGSDGCNPLGVALDSGGNLYGTTEGGCAGGYGLVFKVSPSGTETVLHSFSRDGKDGFAPTPTVAVDAKGNVYGTTNLGGTVGVGTVFKITPAGKETILHSFKGGADGFFPEAGPTLDANGNLYGTTFYGGALDAGTVFKLVKSKETVLHSFGANGVDGVGPAASVTLDARGNIYGTTAQGGSSPNCGLFGCGTIFVIAPELLPGTSAQDVQ